MSHYTQSVPSAESLPPPMLKALLLDDSNFDRARIRRLSERTNLAIDFDEVSSIEEMDEAVRDSSYDLILIDYRLPVGDGLTALDHICHDPRNKDAGKIMITGDAGVGTAVTAMRQGCHDFLSKDTMTVAQLRSAMMNAVEIAQERRLQIYQEKQQHAIILQGLKEALQDDTVQEAVLDMMRQHFGPSNFLSAPQQSAEMDALLFALGDDDEFIFH